MRVLAGRYRLGDAVGRGGSAIVHRGFDRTLKRHVAIKLFFPYGPASDEPSAEVLREARTAAGLNHPNVARIYDYGEVTDDGERTPYLIMELLEGETLADRLTGVGVIEWRRAAEICADIASALAAAHEQDLVHRDVKPRNVMLTPSGVKVLDFGIAAAAGQNSFDTQGRLWGTPAHLAPEQLRGEPTFQAADVYALGLVLFECLTGKRAWPGQSVGEILASRHGRQAPHLPRIAGLPREVARIYEASTAEDPAKRPTAQAVAEVLRTAATTAPELRPAFRISIPAPVQGRSRRRALVTGAVAVMTAVLSIMGLQLANGASTPGGHKAEAAADNPQPAAPVSTSASPSPTATATPTAQATEVVPVTVHRTGGSKSKPRHTATAKPSPSPSESPEPSDSPTPPSDPPASSSTPDDPAPPATSATPDEPPAEPEPDPTDTSDTPSTTTTAPDPETGTERLS